MTLRGCKGRLTLQFLPGIGRVSAVKKRGKVIIYFIYDRDKKRRYFELFRCLWKYARGLAYCMQNCIEVE